VKRKRRREEGRREKCEEEKREEEEEGRREAKRRSNEIQRVFFSHFPHFFFSLSLQVLLFFQRATRGFFSDPHRIPKTKTPQSKTVIKY
jgi:hypothetical protein